MYNLYVHLLYISHIYIYVHTIYKKTNDSIWMASSLLVPCHAICKLGSSNIGNKSFAHFSARLKQSKTKFINCITVVVLSAIQMLSSIYRNLWKCLYTCRTLSYDAHWWIHDSINIVTRMIYKTQQFDDRFTEAYMFYIYLSIFLSIYLYIYIYIYVYVCASLATKHVIRIHPCICNLKTCNVWSVPDQGRTCHRHKMYNTWHRKKKWKTNRRFGAQWSSNSFNLLYPTRITMSHIQFAAKNHLPTLSEAVQYTKRPRCLHWRSR